MATQTQAMRNAKAIEKYWHKRGHRYVRAWARMARDHEGGVAVGYVVESTLVNGAPPPHAEERGR